MCIGLCQEDVKLGWSANFVDINDPTLIFDVTHNFSKNHLINYQRVFSDPFPAQCP